MMYMGWLCMRCCEVTLWTGISMLLLPCVGGVHTDLYSSCTRTDSSSSSSASVWGRAQQGNLHLLSLSACFYHHWGNALLPDLTVSDLCFVGKKSDRALFKHTEEINEGLQPAAQHIIWNQKENPTPFPDRPCIPAWVDVQWRSRMLWWVCMDEYGPLTRWGASPVHVLWIALRDHNLVVFPSISKLSSLEAK